MTRTRLLAALIMAPVAIAAMLLLETPWIMALAAVLFLAGLWEWFELAETPVPAPCCWSRTWR